MTILEGHIHDKQAEAASSARRPCDIPCLMKRTRVTSDSLQMTVVNNWPSLSPVGSMTMLGSGLKDEELLPESPDARPLDLIPSYLPEGSSQVHMRFDVCLFTYSPTPALTCSDALLWILPGCSTSASSARLELMNMVLQIEDDSLGQITAADNNDDHGGLENLFNSSIAQSVKLCKTMPI